MSQQSMPARRGQARILSITAALLCMLVTIFALRLSTQTEEGFGLGDYSGVSAQACLAAFEESGDSGDLVQLLKVLCYQAVVEGDEAAQPLIRQYGTQLYDRARAGEDLSALGDDETMLELLRWIRSFGAK